MPPEYTALRTCKYAIYDATYFHKTDCLMNIMNADTQDIIAQSIVHKENFVDAYPWFEQLARRGLNLSAITVDGERSIMRAIKKAWPQIKIQRCLYHIQHEDMRWLRTYPKTAAGKELRAILKTLSAIKTLKERNAFVCSYRQWLTKHRAFVMNLPRTTIAFKDLQRTISLLNNALPDMFRYLRNSRIHATTNALEGLHSRLKSDYQRHRGLTQEHRTQYIRWYCHFRNQNNNTF